MTKPELVFRRSLEERRQLLHQHSSCSRSNHFAEVAGGTTAEVAAVSCCVPFAVVDFMVLTMYKVPAGLCRNAIRRRRRRNLMMHRNGVGGGKGSFEDSDLSMHPAVKAAAARFLTPETDKDVMELEKEMWEKFDDSGFWRSRAE